MQNKLRTTCFAFALFIDVLSCFHSAAQTSFNYPVTAIRPVSDTIFGKIVTDNFRWLENANNSEVQAWLKEQAELTNQCLDKIPGRNILLEEYKKLDQVNAVEISYASRQAGRYFYIKTLRGENVGKLYYRQGETGKEILLFDPHVYSKKQSQSKEITFWFVPSNDGNKVALSLTDNGKGDIRTVKFLNVNTKTFYPDSLYPVSSPQAWTPDGNGIIYGELQTTDQLSPKLFLDITLKLHLLGTAMKDDKILLSRTTHPDLNINSFNIPFAYYSPDNKYLSVDLWGGPPEQTKRFFAAASDIEKAQIKWKLLTWSDDEVSNAIICKGNVYLLTKKDAPNRKLIVSPLDKLDIAHSKALVAESNQPIEGFTISKDFLFVQKTNGINSVIEQYNLSTGAMKIVKLPQGGSIWPQTFDAFTNDCIMWVSSWKQPLSRYRYNPITGQSTVSALYPKITYPGTGELVVEEIEVKSHDGVMVPLSLVYHKNVKKNGKNVVFLTGYGSYGSSSLPWFEPMFLPLLKRGVIIAISHPRGGGEKGFAWHMGGFKATKPNTWKDFIACAEYMIANGYTSAGHLIGEGTSAGGILIGRAMTERPELFAAAINNVPVSNPFRGENRPNGELDAKEFGTVKDSAEAMGLIEMDAYLHVKRGINYPAVIAVSGINDTRVPVWQPAKFVAALQQANASGRPVLLMINYDSGHWSDEKFVTYRNLANMYSLALWQAGHKDFQLVKNPSD
jgi:prolyl oligopeptidase